MQTEVLRAWRFRRRDGFKKPHRHRRAGTLMTKQPSRMSSKRRTRSSPEAPVPKTTAMTIRPMAAAALGETSRVCTPWAVCPRETSGLRGMMMQCNSIGAALKNPMSSKTSPASNAASRATKTSTTGPREKPPREEERKKGNSGSSSTTSRSTSSRRTVASMMRKNLSISSNWATGWATTPSAWAPPSATRWSGTRKIPTSPCLTTSASATPRRWMN